jgi:hypothetical protein
VLTAVAVFDAIDDTYAQRSFDRSALLHATYSSAQRRLSLPTIAPDRLATSLPSRASRAGPVSACEIPRKYKPWQHGIDRLRAPHIRGHELRFKADALAGAIPNPRYHHRYRTDAGHDRAGGQVAVAHQRKAPGLVMLTSKATQQISALGIDGGLQQFHSSTRSSSVKGSQGAL